MKERSAIECCAFTGHRPDRFSFRYDETAGLCKTIKAKLLEQAERLYQAGVREYWCGGALGTDLWAAEAVLRLKQKYPDVSLCCALPFRDYDGKWRQDGRRRMEAVKANCDEVVTVCGGYSPDAYKRRNYFMVDRCQHLIAVFDQDRSARSGTLQTVNYAKKLGRRIVFIHPDTAEVSE